MKKIFTLIAAAMMAVAANAEELISYQAQTEAMEVLPAGVAISGTTVQKTVKYKTNTTNMTCLQLANGYSADGKFNGNAIILSVDGGFKAGDVVTIAGYINNADAAKRATAVLFTLNEDNTTNKLNVFADFINGRLVDDDPVEESFTLEEDADKLYFGRDGGTGANLYTIKVTRDPSAVESVKSDAPAKAAPKKVLTSKGVMIGNTNVAGAQVK